MLITLCMLQAAAQSIPTPTGLLWSLWAWLYLHWVVVVAVLVWIVVNVIPRPHPETLTGWKRVVWRIVDAICLLTAAKLPGGLKWPIVQSPPLVVPADDRTVVPADTVKTEDKK